MTRYKCTVAYDGAAYCGWQSQLKGNSIQEQIENALHRLAHRKTVIVAAGRTDAGVNARGQVFHFDTPLEMSPFKWKGALNGYLPKDIHIIQVETVDELFHARYCVRSKRYDYRINTGEYDVCTRDWAYQCPFTLDEDQMKKAAQYLIGTHDFTSLCSNTLAETPDQVRTIDAIEFSRQGDILTISYYGRGFLRYMVRMMSAQLMDVGRHKEEPEHVRYMLEHPSKELSRHNARPEGLTLMQVNYYDVLAASEEAMIREFLIRDELPEGQTLAELEQRAAAHARPRMYALVTRHEQQMIGRLEIADDGAGCLRVYGEKGYRAAGELLPQLSRVMQARGEALNGTDIQRIRERSD